jgi:tetratricopeptide (TPR) repeat protein
MKANPESSGPPNGFSPSRWTRLLVVGCVLVIFLALLSRRHRDNPDADRAAATNSVQANLAESAKPKSSFERARRSASSPAPTAEEIVANKVLQFGRSRHALVRAIARRSGKTIPSVVEKFFDAIESGDWKEIDAQWKVMAEHSGQYEYSKDHWEDLNPFWPSVLDAYGVAEQAHDWPAQKLLDYGNAILDSLRPGMVYVGGTDPGRWIPELLNDTSSGEQHIIVTQNAFADGRYLEFMQQLYGERFLALTMDDSKRAFEEYKADAQRRLEHDQQFPDEPKQIRPGEDPKLVDGKLQVSGQVAVMAINEKLLQMLMAKNPNLSFAIEQSFPMKSTYENATPVGPIMELGVRDEQNALTRERAGQSVDYWRATTQQLLSDPQADSDDVRMSYAKLALNQAALLLDRHYAAEAEQTYRLALELAPSSREAVFTYVNLLTEQNRVEEAIPIAEKALQWSSAPERRTPENEDDRQKQSKLYQDLLKQLQAKKKN